MTGADSEHPNSGLWVEYPPPRPPIFRSTGETPSERYLAELADKSFLRLWSYPNTFIDKKQGGKGDGKELCDLLVVCGDHVLIFSDSVGSSSSITRTVMMLEGDCVDASIALKDDRQGALHRTGFFRQAFHLDEDVFLAAASSGGTGATSEGTPSWKQVGLAGVGEFCLCHGSAP